MAIHIGKRARERERERERAKECEKVRQDIQILEAYEACGCVDIIDRVFLRKTENAELSAV